jgi:GDPmannose 4,6-dehydratase
MHALPSTPNNCSQSSGNRLALIVGALGQDGHYLTQHLLGLGYRVIGTTHRSLESVTASYSGELLQFPLDDFSRISEILKKYQPDEIYNLAARASSAQLLDDALASGDINGLAVTRILTALVQHAPRARFCQALSSEIFANSCESPQHEATPMTPCNAYGAAKAYARHSVIDFRANRGVFACGAILYNHESTLRPSHFVTRKVTQAAARIALGSKEFLQLGNAEHRRDWGHAHDYVRAMHLMLNHSVPDDYIVATGITHSIADLCEIAFEFVGLDYRQYVKFQPNPLRRREIQELRGNPSKASRNLGWKAETSFRELIREMVEFDLNAFRQAKL